VQLADGVLSFRPTLKRLESGTTVIFMLWMTGSALVFLCIAILFLRNQVRPIRQLAEAAENFGKGQDMPGFKPHGALEVRRAARAFLIMRDRIARQIRSRTEMLAGISHDLRTPLTRMKLQLALPQDAQAARAMSEDVGQMERMIAEYLDFARGEGGEESAVVRLKALMQDIADDYARLGKKVPVEAEDATITLREGAFRRMMHNLIDNAIRYGKECRVSAAAMPTRVEICVDDKGPGIPAAQREEVFRPFTRLDASRNPATGGVGLGLTIARDVARSHGGDISLSDAPGGGLRVLVRLPL
jgi:two-component system osmolarity sensor histidine kinase EnvZ